MRSLQGYIRWCTLAQRTLGAVTAALIVSFYFFGYRPCSARLAELQQKTKSAQIEFRANQVRSSIKTQIAASNERARAELDRIRKPSRAQDLWEVVKDLSRYSQQSALRKFDYKTGIPGRTDLFCEQPILLTFEGDFMNVFSFLRSAEDMQRLTRVRTLTIKCKDGKESKETKTGQVQATVSMNVYLTLD